MNDRHHAPPSGDGVETAAMSPFTRYADRDVVDLIGEYPLAWVCAAGGDPTRASLLPLLVETDDGGRPIALIGHVARRNPLAAAFRDDPRCLALFTGPHAYISPTVVGDRQWAPTWNYAQVRIEGTLAFDAEVHPALTKLVAAMEAAQPMPWHADEMGPRYDVLATAVVGFRVDVARVEGRFKLGQDERPEVLRQILARLPGPDLVRWMTRFNAARLATATEQAGA